jgi:hypothetical protein
MQFKSLVVHGLYNVMQCQYQYASIAYHLLGLHEVYSMDCTVETLQYKMLYPYSKELIAISVAKFDSLMDV